MHRRFYDYLRILRDEDTCFGWRLTLTDGRWTSGRALPYQPRNEYSIITTCRINTTVWISQNKRKGLLWCCEIFEWTKSVIIFFSVMNNSVSCIFVIWFRLIQTKSLLLTCCGNYFIFIYIRLVFYFYCFTELCLLCLTEPIDIYIFIYLLYVIKLDIQYPCDQPFYSCIQRKGIDEYDRSN